MADVQMMEAQKIGKATYYADRFHGRRTSSGDIYHKDSFTCAHKTLPFGTMLKIKDTKTGNEVVVKVNDRLGWGTTVDLSYAAAKELGIINRGSAQVEISPYIDTEKIPYKSKDMEIPRLRVKDPLGDGYCLLSEWQARNNIKMLKESLAKSAESMKKSSKALIHEQKDSIPHYKILDQLTALGDHKSIGRPDVIMK